MPFRNWCHGLAIQEHTPIGMSSDVPNKKIGYRKYFYYEKLKHQIKYHEI